jgi:retron-type reverse transcriptase
LQHLNTSSRLLGAASVAMWSAIFEADFEDSAYGYRPRRSAIDAIKETHPQIGGAASSTETCCG